MDSKFVGAPDDIATPFCAGYVMVIFSFAYSGMFALLPLTIDRAVAVMVPLRHSSIITKRTCAILFLATWLSIVAVLIDTIVEHQTGAISIVFSDRYHRCVMLGRDLVVQNIILFIVPFFFVLLTYVLIFFIVVKAKRSFGQFLILTVVIITTNLLSYTPGVILDIVDISMSYEVMQVMYSTFWYVNGVVNPLIYVGAHPKTRRFITSWWQRNGRTDIELQERTRRTQILAASSDVLSVNTHSDTVRVSNMSTTESEC